MKIGQFLQLLDFQKDFSCYKRERCLCYQGPMVFYHQEEIPIEWYQDSLSKNFKLLDSYWSKNFDIKSEVG